MYLRLLLSSLKNNHIFFERQFRLNSRLFKDVTEMKQTDEINKDEPVKYSTSNAAKWKGIYSTSGKSYYETPRIQPTVVVLSLTAFMVYFCILREENDLDDWLKKLETTIPIQVEEAQLLVEIESGRKKGNDVSWQESRLKEITSQREKIMANKQ